MYLLIIQIILIGAGATSLVMGLRHRAAGVPFFAGEWSIRPSIVRHKFRDDAGHRLFLAGKIMLSLGGLLGAIYWLWLY